MDIDLQVAKVVPFIWTPSDMFDVAFVQVSLVDGDG